MTAQPQPDRKAMPLGPGDPDYDKWNDELEHYLSIRTALCARPDLLGKYIAMRDHKIIDMDDDDFALAHRAARNYRGLVVFISKVEPNDPVINMPPMEFR